MLVDAIRYRPAYHQGQATVTPSDAL